MSITENIISFAAQQGGSFTRKELLEALRSDASLNEASLLAVLGCLVATGRLAKTGWGLVMKLTPKLTPKIARKKVLSYV